MSDSDLPKPWLWITLSTRGWSSVWRALSALPGRNRFGNRVASLPGTFYYTLTPNPLSRKQERGQNGGAAR